MFPFFIHGELILEDQLKESRSNKPNWVVHQSCNASSLFFSSNFNFVLCDYNFISNFRNQIKNQLNIDLWWLDWKIFWFDLHNWFNWLIKSLNCSNLDLNNNYDKMNYLILEYMNWPFIFSWFYFFYLFCILILIQFVFTFLNP